MADHPIAHVPADTAHQWMREECAALDAARQAREDNLMNVIIQTSSAAVLAIPGLFIAIATNIPTFVDAWPIYLGTASFGLAFACACAEQVLSAKAYQAQRTVVQDYYAKRSDKTCDDQAIDRVDVARNAALAIFAIAVTLSALGLALFARGIDVKAASTPDNSVIAPRADTPTPASAIEANDANTSASTQSSPNTQSGTTTRASTNSEPGTIPAADGATTPGRAGTSLKPRANSAAATVTEKGKVN